MLCCLFITSSVLSQSTINVAYEYDAFNRLVKTSDGTNTTIYNYDELGNRTQQSVSVVLSVSEHQVLGLNLFPNPTPKLVTITAKNTIEKVIIYDVTGKVLKEQKSSKNTIEIDISSFSVGVYHFTVFSDGKKQSLKVVKQ